MELITRTIMIRTLPLMTSWRIIVKCAASNVCFFKLVANFPFNILPHCFWPSWTKHLLELSPLLLAEYLQTLLLVSLATFFCLNFESGTGLLTCTLPKLLAASRSYIISTRKNFKIVTKQRKPGKFNSTITYYTMEGDCCNNSINIPASNGLDWLEKTTSQ